MSARVGFTASDAERQTADSATNYMNRALRMLAERLALEKSLERAPAAFAVQFAPLLSALIEAQAREYQSWVFFDRLETLVDANERGLSDLAGVLDRRLEFLEDRLSFELAGVGNRLEDMNEEARRRRPHDPRATYRQVVRAVREAGDDGR